jgi:hypothetical protein
MMLQARLDPSGGCGPVAPLNFWDVQREARGPNLTRDAPSGGASLATHVTSLSD